GNSVTGQPNHGLLGRPGGGTTASASAKPGRRHCASTGAVSMGTMAIAGVGSAVAIGWPPRLNRHDAPGGAVSTRISIPFGGVPQPATVVRPRTVKISLRHMPTRAPRAAVAGNVH